MGNLGLIRRVRGVPAGIFENVALDHRRRDAVVVAQTDVRAEDLILRGDGTGFVQDAEFTPTAGQTERAPEPNVGGHRGINQFVQAGNAERLQHLPNVLRARADVAADKTVGMLQQFHRFRSGTPGFSGRVFFGRFPREHGGKVSGVGANASGIS